GVNSHRLLIHANRTKNVAEEKESKIEEEATKNINVRLILMMMAIIIVVIIIYLISRKYKKGQ
ncbi:MAG: hypothetical protein ACRC3Y_00740, partial [Romboutsia sp.]|uniref:hypothetical protein n=1 Tax=Romboutsia sp. TaxID=1965302 RepID=UPI003F2B124F